MHKLDDRTTLVVVDVQALTLAMVPGADEVMRRTLELAHAFEGRHLPVYACNVVGQAPGRTDEAAMPEKMPEGWRDIPDELLEVATYTFSKRTWSLFGNGEFVRMLRAIERTQLVVCGFTTHIGVQATAVDAYGHGYNVAVVADATADFAPELHQQALATVLPYCAELTTTAEVRSRLHY